MEGVESEHLLDAEPRHRLRLDDDDAEDAAKDEVWKEDHAVTRGVAEAAGRCWRNTAREKAAHCKQRRRLRVGQPCYRVPGCAAACVGRSEPDEKAADYDEGDALDREEGRPREHLARRKAGQVVQSELLQCRDRMLGECQDLWWGNQGRDEGSRKSPARKARFHPPSRFQSCARYSMPHGATAAQRCLKLLETPKDLFPSRSSAGTIRPMMGPAMYHGKGCGNSDDMPLLVGSRRVAR